MKGVLAQFLGDSPFRVIVKLAVVSFVVGMVMNAFDWSPFDIVDTVYRFVLHLWNMGFQAIENVLEYLLLGAAVVVPAFIILRILSYRR